MPPTPKLIKILQQQGQNNNIFPFLTLFQFSVGDKLNKHHLQNQSSSTNSTMLLPSLLSLSLSLSLQSQPWLLLSGLSSLLCTASETTFLTPSSVTSTGGSSFLCRVSDITSERALSSSPGLSLSTK